MIIEKYYDDVKKIDEVWYDSSSIYYSKFEEKSNTLTVVFKTGLAYEYFNVDVQTDYVLFKTGGLDGSHGKALNKFIKSKYEFKRLSQGEDNLFFCDKRLDDVKKLKEIDKTYFISGHRDITYDEFSEYYKKKLIEINEYFPDSLFVVGDYYGVDIMAQNFLLDELGIDPERITVYHMLEAPRNINQKILNRVGGFKSDEERDAAMTDNSKYDVAFVRDHTELSGTAMNILRRFNFKKIVY